MNNPHKLIKIIFAIVIIVLVLLTSYVIYTKFLKPTKSVVIDSKPISYVYLWNNQDFINAEKLTIEGRYTEALDVYNSLLQSDLSREDVITKSQINIRIATLLDAMGEKAEAIRALNQIATNDKEYFITRSFSYEYMARMLYETRDQLVLLEIVQITGIKPTSETDQYTAVSQELLRKSNDISPLYLSLTQKMVIELNKLSTYTPENTKKIRYELGLIDRMIFDIRKEQNQGYMLPLAQLRKAKIAERLQESGNYGLPQTPDKYYLDAIDAYEKYPEARSYNYAYYEYARYLAVSGGASKKDQIVTSLEHYKQNASENNNLKTYLKNLEKYPTSKAYKELQVLTKISGPLSL